MSRRSWIIGSDAQCQVVVPDTTVSAFHVRLTRDGNRLYVEDLGSETGVYVGGKRISEKTEVTFADSIRLGPSCAMPWPAELLGELRAHFDSITEPAGSGYQVISIGRHPRNLVMLDEPNISSFHARLIIGRQGMEIEDLDSTNGTSVGDVTNKIHRVSVAENDVVYFGSTSYSVAELLGRASVSLSGSASHHAEPGPNHAKSVFRKLFQSRVAFVSVLLMVAVPAVWGAVHGIRSLFSDAPWATRPTHGRDVFVAPDETPRRQLRREAEAPSDRATREGPRDSRTVRGPGEQGEKPADRSIADFLYVVACSTPDRSESYRLGTAFAVAPHALATSGSVAELVRQYRKSDYPIVIVYHPPSRRELGDVRFESHDEFERARNESLRARRQHDAIKRALESSAGEDGDEAEAKRKLLDARLRSIEALDRQTCFDVAVIRTEDSLPCWLPIAHQPAALHVSQRLMVFGYAIDRKDFVFAPEYPIDLRRFEARVEQIVRLPGAQYTQLRASATEDHINYVYVGSPVIDANGSVVAIYSRPTPTADGSVSRSFDAPWVAHVPSLLAGAATDPIE